MQNDLVSIPIMDVFEPKDGCPICRLHAMLEKRVVEFVTGAAMMEPSVRIQTNEQGFCPAHFQKMLEQQNRLGVALILESHLAEVDKSVFGREGFLGKSAVKQAKDAGKQAQTCYVCNIVEKNMDAMLSTVCRLWENEKDFRQLFEEQPQLCLPHFSRLVETAGGQMNKKNLPEFSKAASALSRRYLQSLREDVSHFCKMFDYRSADIAEEWGNSKDSIERAIHWLTSFDPSV